jgi:hypothetical protein
MSTALPGTDTSVCHPNNIHTLLCWVLMIAAFNVALYV